MIGLEGMSRRWSGAIVVAICLCGGVSDAQDSTRSAPNADSVRATRLQRAKASAARLGRGALLGARRAGEFIFDADSAVEQWTLHRDAASATARVLAPIAFWVPVAAVITVPVVWADEAEEGHLLNAQYAGSATAALALGLVVSRATKHFVHRARPCTGAPPDRISTRSDTSRLPPCPRSSRVSGSTSFFSEHTMSLFAIASATSFQLQRQNAPNATAITIAAFSGASVFSLARIYQRHHWLSDVIVGAAVGTASGLLAAQLGPAPRRTR